MNRILAVIVLSLTCTGLFSQCYVRARSTNTLCFGSCNGAAFVDSISGTAPFTYSWSPGNATTSAISGLCPGTYTVIMTDNTGCTAVTSVSVFQPSALTIFKSSNPNTGCCNGNAVAIAGGGTPPYSYSWSNGNSGSSISALCGGTYVITVTDNNGCVKQDSVIISGAGPLTVTVTANPSTGCYACNGNANATAGGGTPPYAYSWSTGPTTASVSSLCAGTFSVTITDNSGCTRLDSAVITGPAVLGLSVSSIPSALCTPCNGSASANAWGGTMPYSYSWNNGQTTATASGLCSGIYRVILTDNLGCTKLDSVTVSGPTGPSLVTSAQPASCFNCADGSATVNVTGGAMPYTFSWSNGGTAQNNTNLVPGNYMVCVTDANSCRVCDSVIVSFMTAIMAQANHFSFQIAPNPAQSFITINTNTDLPEAQLSLLNVVGELISSQAVSLGRDTSLRLPVSRLQPGIYFIRIDAPAGTVTRKFIKE